MVIDGGGAATEDPNSIFQMNASTFHANPGDKVKYVLIPGGRIKSELIYSEDEQQFYKKSKRLASGLISACCRQPNCTRKVYLDPVSGDCTYKHPYVPHNHSPKGEEFNLLTALNKVKKSCTDPAKISANGSKTSVVKTIYDGVLEE